MTDLTHRTCEANGIRQHFVEAGKGPLVLLLHGFPGLWYSWRHQLSGLAEAGYRVVAPDLRGYGGTDSPEDPSEYTQLHLAGDVVGLLDELETETATLVGHDFGASLAWNVAVLRPDRVRAVAGFAVPYIPRGPVSFLTMMRAIVGEGFYMAYFQRPGRAEADLEADLDRALRGLFESANGDVTTGRPSPLWVVPEGGSFLDVIGKGDRIPSWMTEDDLKVYLTALARSGFRGPLNWFRTFDSSWALMGAWTNAPLFQPAMYAVGERDPFFAYPGVDDLLRSVPEFAPRLGKVTVVAGGGHYLPEELPQETNELLLDFFQRNGSSAPAPAGAVAAREAELGSSS